MALFARVLLGLGVPDHDNRIRFARGLFGSVFAFLGHGVPLWIDDGPESDKLRGVLLRVALLFGGALSRRNLCAAALLGTLFRVHQAGALFNLLDGEHLSSFSSRSRRVSPDSCRRLKTAACSTRRN